MSTRGQNNIDKIRNLIEETEEQKKYELEQLNNTITNKLIKGAPLKQINLVNTALKLKLVIGLLILKVVLDI